MMALPQVALAPQPATSEPVEITQPATLEESSKLKLLNWWYIGGIVAGGIIIGLAIRQLTARRRA